MTVALEAEERMIALTAVLDLPALLQSRDADLYRLVYLHERWLRAWLRERPGWRLVHGPGFFRVERIPPYFLPERSLGPLRRPLDGACLSWILCFASQRGGVQQNWFALAELAQQVQLMAGDHLRLTERDHRESLVRALSYLSGTGLLTYAFGDPGQWAGDGSAEAASETVYEFTPGTARLLAATTELVHQAACVATVGERSLTLVPETGEKLQRAWAALLIGPMLWQHDDPDAFAALAQHQEQVATDLEQDLGWTLEVSSEFARAWRMTTSRSVYGGLLEAVPAPGEGEGESRVKYLYHPVLLLTARVRQMVAEGALAVGQDGTVPITDGNLQTQLAALVAEHRSKWGVEQRRVPPDQLILQICRRMRWMGYLRGPDKRGMCYLMPVAGLLSGRYPESAPVQLEALRQTAAAAQLSFFTETVEGGEGQ